MTTTASDLETGSLVEIRGQRWIVSTIEPADSSTLVGLQSIEEGHYGDTLELIWEVEPGRRVLPAGSLPEVRPDVFDPPDQLAAFLDAIRWSAVTSADVKTLQAPFRSGVAIEDYQLEPVARAVEAPRVNLLLADDVGLGKTIEAGLVAQELLLRHRASKIMIVCPAGLIPKWRDEMAEKFGLHFTVIDSECCAQVRRTYGSAANPFNIYPLTLVSLPWLRGAKAQRLLDEVLPSDGPSRTFDLLILDEAHHVAPKAPKQVYAVDSQQTKLIRKLAPHFTNRLFLSATPHNGYWVSFTALLEILDPQRFARGVEPDRTAVKDVVVRRLKRHITDEHGNLRFPPRQTKSIPVEYPESEREIHRLLGKFSELRRKKLTSRRGRKATDLITLLLKKRLFSSPAAFAHTVDVYLATLTSRQTSGSDAADEIPPWMEEFWDEVATYDDQGLAEAEDDAVGRARPMQPDATDDETAVLTEMRDWALAHEARPDAKATQLIEYLTAQCKPDGKNWTNERVVVFTEYRDTQGWLVDLLRQEGLGGDHVAILHGGMGTDEREQLRLAFQKDPTEHPVRILIATDAASEGIDLQRHCHKLVNYDIPFNPNKLEQRIGRIDRYGQTKTPEVWHFVGTGWGHAVDAFEADLEFLSRVAGKVAQMEEDLGSVNAVLADQVQRKMLGETITASDLESATSSKRSNVTESLPAETDVTRQVRQLREHIETTVSELGITPQRVKRVVETALALARQQPLTEHIDEKELAEGLYDVPTLTGSWVRATTGLIEKLKDDEQGRDDTPRQLPITFDGDEARSRDDVVLAHLNHPLVSMSTRLLRTAVSSEQVGLQRVTAVVSDHPDLEDVLVGAYSRFVLVGTDGLRLHEEILHAGGWAPENGRFRRLENLTTLGNILDHALIDGSPLPSPIWPRIAARWSRVADPLLNAIDWRSNTRLESLRRRLEQREEDERRRVNAIIEQFSATLHEKLAEDDEDALFGRSEVAKSPEELAQYRRDRQSWQRRLDSLTAERDRELEAIAARYAHQEPHRFPVAVVFVVPEKEATR